MTKIFFAKHRRALLFLLAGALIGFLYYTFFGCTTGCPIKSSPVVTTVYCAVIGGLLSVITEKDPKKKTAEAGDSKESAVPAAHESSKTSGR